MPFDEAGNAVCAEVDSAAAGDSSRCANHAGSAAAEKALRMTYVSVPLITGALLLKGEDTHFRNMRGEHIPKTYKRNETYIQYLPLAVTLGLKAFGVESRSSWARMAVSGAAGESHNACGHAKHETPHKHRAPRQLRRPFLSLGAHGHGVRNGHNTAPRVRAYPSARKHRRLCHSRSNGNTAHTQEPPLGERRGRRGGDWHTRHGAGLLHYRRAVPRQGAQHKRPHRRHVRPRRPPDIHRHSHGIQRSAREFPAYRQPALQDLRRILRCRRGGLLPGQELRDRRQNRAPQAATS